MSKVTLSPYLPTAFRRDGNLYCAACGDPARDEQLNSEQADETVGAVCPGCQRPVRADERPGFYVGSAFVGTTVEQEIDGVLHEQALDYFVALSMPELRKRQGLASQQIGIAFRRCQRGDSPALMASAMLKLQATESLLMEAIMRKTQSGSPWRTLKRPVF